MKLVMFVLHDATKLHDLLAAWREAGAGGATVLLSTGMGRLQLGAGLREDLPLMPSPSDFYSHEEELSRTIFTLVPDQATVDRLVAATHRLVGDLDQPDTGLLAVLPVEQAAGLNKKRA
jgi:hypothetical protein